MNNNLSSLPFSSAKSKEEIDLIPRSNKKIKFNHRPFVLGEMLDKDHDTTEDAVESDAQRKVSYRNLVMASTLHYSLEGKVATELIDSEDSMRTRIWKRMKSARLSNLLNRRNASYVNVKVCL